MKRAVLAALLFAALAQAHAISISTGDATIRGQRMEYILRMPQYELKEGTSASMVFALLTFQSRGEMAKLMDAECHVDAAKNQYLCAADYTFSQIPGDIEVHGNLQAVTVPNHVHMLKAERDGKFDQAILDSSFPTGLLTFRPPTETGIAFAQISASMLRVASSGAQILLLLALAFAARSHRERVILAAAYFAGECLTVAVLSKGTWLPTSRFAEAAAALGIAYLALELLAFPKAGSRWLPAFAFGTFSGLYFTAFLRDSGYRLPYVLSGAVLTGAFLFALGGLLSFLLNRQKWMDRWRTKLHQFASISLLITGAIWFFLRLRS